MLLDQFVAIVVILPMTGLIGSTHLFALDECAGQGDIVCAQSDVSLPIPSEDDIAGHGQEQQGDQAGGPEEGSTGQDDEATGNDNAGSTFLLPFP